MKIIKVGIERTPYSAAKWAVVGFTKSLAMELGPANIRVNAIQPGVVEGDRIVNRYVERGTLTGAPFLGIEPAGQRYAKPGTTVYRVADGRLAESWGVEDTLGWFRQLGRYAA